MRAAEAAETATGVGIGFIVAAERHCELEEAEELAGIVREQAIDGSMTIHGRRGIVGFGLHGSEGGFPPGPFREVFRKACEGTGVVSIPHAGEIAPSSVEGGVKDGPASVLDACRCLNAHRIGHGVLAIEDTTVLNHLADQKICLDICVTSNYLLSVVPSIKDHPLPTLLARGIPCTINSDDPLLFGASLLGEYEICRSDLGLSDDAIASCARASFEFSRAPQEIVQRGVQDIAIWLESK